MVLPSQPNVNADAIIGLKYPPVVFNAMWLNELIKNIIKTKCTRSVNIPNSTRSTVTNELAPIEMDEFQFSDSSATIRLMNVIIPSMAAP